MLLAALVACAPAPEADPTAVPTWHADVAPIFAARCGGCHTSGGPAPFRLDDYVAAGPMAEAALAAIDAGTMPPFDVYETETCSSSLPWREDPRLTEAELAIVRAWTEGGAPEGDPAKAAPLPDTTPPGLDEVTLELIPEEGWSTSGDEDEFRCVSLDPQLTEDAWVTGVEVIPGNTLVNHHVVLTTDPTASSAAWGNRYKNCFNVGDPEGGQPLLVWTPGADPVDLPDDVGIPVPAGSRIVMQIHFHPTGPEAEPDRTTVRLRLTDRQPDHQLFLVSVGNFPDRASGLQPGPSDRGWTPEFRIPARASDHVETMELTVGETETFRVYSIMPHQHYLGTDIELRWRHAFPRAGEPVEECARARWRFDWQRNYVYDAPVDELPTGRTGDVLTLTCRYDNSMDNPWLRQALADAGLDKPIDVYLGEETLDEMCLGIYGLIL